MHINGWIVAAALALGPTAMAASTDNVFDQAHQRLGQGVGLVVQGRYAEAEKPLRQALRDNPNLREGHYNLAVSLHQQGRNDEAIAEYDRALQLTAPDDESTRARCLYGAALARESRGDKDAWDAYIAFARPWRKEQPALDIAEERQAMLKRPTVPGAAQKASR